MYDRFLPVGKLHKKSREACEKLTTSRRPSSRYSSGKEAQFGSTHCSWGYGWEKTLREFSIPSTANVATGPNVNVGDVNFELKSSLINMVQASPLCGKPNECWRLLTTNFKRQFD